MVIRALHGCGPVRLGYASCGLLSLGDPRRGAVRIGIGSVRNGMAGLAKAKARNGPKGRSGKARSDSVRWSQVRLVTVRLAVTRTGKARLGVLLSGMVRSGVCKHCSGAVWHRSVRSGEGKAGGFVLPPFFV